MYRAATRLLPGLASFVVVLAIWELAGRYRYVNPVLLPPPSVIGVTLWEIVRSGALLVPLGQTFLLLFVGYALACLFGIALGLVMGRSEVIYGLLEPLIELLRPIPKAALVPPLFLFLGFGATMKITIVALAAFFPILIATIQGVRGVDRVAIDTARTFGCTGLALNLRIILPASLPMIATASTRLKGGQFWLTTHPNLAENSHTSRSATTSVKPLARVRAMRDQAAASGMVGRAISMPISRATEWPSPRQTRISHFSKSTRSPSPMVRARPCGPRCVMYRSIFSGPSLSRFSGRLAAGNPPSFKSSRA